MTTDLLKPPSGTYGPLTKPIIVPIKMLAPSVGYFWINMNNNHDKKETAYKSYKTIGYVQDLIDSGIPDPIAYYSNVVAQMNIEAKRIKEENKAKQIGESPEIYLGYFLLQRKQE